MAMISFKRSFASLAMALLVSAGTAFAAPAEIKISPDQARSTLSQEHQKAVKARIDWWASTLRLSQDSVEITEISRSLLRDFGKVDTPFYRNFFAKACAERMSKMLAGTDFSSTDKLAETKRINVAMAFSKMPTESSISVYETLITDANAGVRLIGWTGMLRTRETIFAGKTWKKTVTDFGKAFKAETSPLVLNAMFKFADLSNQKAQAIDPATKTAASKQFLADMQASWKNIRIAIRDTEQQDLMKAAGRGNITIANIAQLLSADQATKTTCLQMILDMSYSGALKVNNQWEQRSERPLLIASLKQMLLDSEKALTTIAKGKNHVAAAFEKASDKNAVGVGDAIELSVLNWAEDIKKAGMKVTDPEAIKAAQAPAAKKTDAPKAPATPPAAPPSN